MILEIDNRLAQAILDYLKGKPYEEVYLLIADLLKLKPVEASHGANDQAD